MGMTKFASAALLAAGAISASGAFPAQAAPSAVSAQTTQTSSEPVTDSPGHGGFAKQRPCPFDDETAGALPCVWDGRHMGNGGGLSFWFTGTKVVFYRHAVAHRLAFGEWRPVPDRLVGEKADLVKTDGSRRITRTTRWSVGDTSLFVWKGTEGPRAFAVGTS